MVVGSNGKTTVKEMIGAILRAHYGAAEVLATAGNFNNAIGLPLTLLRLSPSHRAAVVELGMNHRGETRALAAIAAPTIVVINNAQREHQEFMASVAEVAAEHADALHALSGDGTAVLNADDAFLPLWRDAAIARGARVTTFGLDSPADFTADVTLRADGSDVALHTPAGEASIRSRGTGTAHGQQCIGGGRDGVCRRGDAAGHRAGAWQRSCRSPDAWWPSAACSGALVIDDTYNANPDSVRAAIDVLAAATGDKWLLLGDMGEVGAAGPAFHREIGAYARTRGVHRLLATGDMTRETVAAFGAGATHYDNVDALQSDALSGTRAGITMLVKGSRFMRMERVVAALTGTAGWSGPLMLLALSEWLEQYARAFNVFSYITLRAVLATMTALVISFVIGPKMIAWLSAMKIGQSVRDDGPQTHLVKAGTPTMGGALILVSIAVTTLLWGNLANRFVWVVLLVMLGFGAIGWVDDWRKVVYRNPKGLSARAKLALAIGDRHHRRGVPRVRHLCAGQPAVRAALFGLDAKRLQCRTVAQDRSHRAVLQVDLLSAGRIRIHRACVLRDRGHEQRGQSHRRSRRPRDHADGDGGQRAWHLRVCHRQCDLRALPWLPAHTGRRRTRGHLRRHCRGGIGISVVQRLSGGRLHG